MEFLGASSHTQMSLIDIFTDSEVCVADDQFVLCVCGVVNTDKNGAVEPRCKHTRCLSSARPPFCLLFLFIYSVAFFCPHAVVSLERSDSAFLSCSLRLYSCLFSLQVKLSRLCEQDKILQELEATICTLKEDKVRFLFVSHILTVFM